LCTRRAVTRPDLMHVIARAGKPVARLVPIDQVPRPKQLGLLRGRIKVPAGFNAPLRADVLADFQGR